MEKSRLCNFLNEVECYLPWQFTNSRATEKEIKKLNSVRLCESREFFCAEVLLGKRPSEIKTSENDVDPLARSG